MCRCDPTAGITCGPHFIQGMREHAEEIERRTVMLAESLIAEAEQIAGTTTKPEETPLSTTRPEPETDEANEAAVQAARDAYRPAYEQGLDSDIASCADWFGWHAAIKAAKAQILREEIGALRERLAKADRELAYIRSNSQPLSVERLDGKIAGVRLALSYVDEALRMAQPAEEAQR